MNYLMALMAYGRMSLFLKRMGLSNLIPMDTYTQIQIIDRRFTRN